MENFYKFDGRACRMEAISFIIVYSLTLLFVSLLSLIYTEVSHGDTKNFLTFWLTAFGTTTLVHLIPSISLATRRLHDINLTGWLQLIYFFPTGNLILLIIYCVIPGNERKNQYGFPSENY